MQMIKGNAEKKWQRGYKLLGRWKIIDMEGRSQWLNIHIISYMNTRI